MCRQAGQMKSSQCQNVQQSVFTDRLYHKSTLIQMRIQHDYRLFPGKILPSHINIAHRIIGDLEFPCMTINHPAYLFFKSAGTKCIGKLFHQLNISHFFSPFSVRMLPQKAILKQTLKTLYNPLSQIARFANSMSEDS